MYISFYIIIFFQQNMYGSQMPPQSPPYSGPPSHHRAINLPHNPHLIGKSNNHHLIITIVFVQICKEINNILTWAWLLILLQPQRRSSVGSSPAQDNNLWDVTLFSLIVFIKSVILDIGKITIIGRYCNIQNNLIITSHACNQNTINLCFIYLMHFNKNSHKNLSRI